jgi:hypothetical protein
METEFIARACADHGIPLLALRVITDTPTQPFPAPPSVLFDIQTATNSHRCARQLFPRPSERVPGLVQFARRIARARKILASALNAIVQGIEAGSGH